MKRILIGLLLVAGVLAGLANPALAGGIGVYAEGSWGDGEFEYEPFGPFDVDAETKGFGLVIDTELSNHGPMNFRLNIGYEQLKLPDNFGTSLDLDGGMVATTFGFALYQDPHLRWWAGPQFKLGYYEGSLNDNPFGDYQMVGAGIGLVTGLNIVGDMVTFSPSVGVLYSAYAGETNEFGPVQDIVADTTTAFVNLSVLFGR